MSRLCPAGAMIDLATADTVATAGGYARLLGRASATPVPVRNGSVRWHQFDGPVGEGQDGDVDENSPSGSHRVSFGVADRVSAARLLQRRGLAPTEPVHVTEDTGAMEMHGPEVNGGDITAIDHLVFTAPSRDRALAVFGACLDLDFRLDREIGDGARQLFFRAADLVVEVVTGSAQATGDAQPCSLWGVAWRSQDAELTHRRLGDLGVSTSEVRIGRKPGTRLFTVRDPALATRTVVIETDTGHTV
ncbi:hypothetical protein GTV32_04335 [Gordonia sp. SID5947]|nr:hypothetical protein [Gordonia sp. SID5947]